MAPPGPQERNKDIKEKINFLKQQLEVEQTNLASYEDWRAKMIANPPT
jgi:hypothetical protein